MQHEKLRYQPNKLGQLLTIGGMVFMVIALFRVINIFRYTNKVTLGLVTPTIMLGVEILVAIFIMLLSFLLSEKFKTYTASWLPVGIGLTAYSIVKIFLYPIQLFNKLNEMIALEEPVTINPNIWLTTIIILLSVSALLYLAATIITYIKVKQLKQYQEELDGQNAK